MNPYEYTAIDPYVCDRALLHYLAAFKRIRSVNSYRVLLILLAKCKWSITFSGDSKHPVARIINNGQLKLTSSEAFERYEIYPSAFYTAICDLEVRGIIEVAKHGKGAGNLYAIQQSPLLGFYRHYSSRPWRPG